MQSLVTVFRTVGLIVSFTMSSVTDGYKTIHLEYQTHSFLLTNYNLLFGYNDG